MDYYVVHDVGPTGRSVSHFDASTVRAIPLTHLDVGHQWNGKRVLAGNVESGEKKRIPVQVPFA